jgi:hypothetical protein
MAEEPVKGGQGTTPDVRRGGTLSHDKAGHDSLAGSGSGISGAHKAVESGGDSGPESLANKQARDYVAPIHYGNDPANMQSATGAGQTKDATEFGRVAGTVDLKETDGADADVGAMAAWGGMQKKSAMAGLKTGTVDIEKPGYPMAGEPTSGGGKGTVSGAVAD